MRQLPLRFRLFLELVGSVRFGVILLLVIAAVSALGTFILQSPTVEGGDAFLKAHYGASSFRVLHALRLTDLYHAPWYHGLLGLLALNVVCATVRWFSLRPEKLGFLAAHVGVLLVLVGGALYLELGRRGTVQLAAGESADDYVSRRDGNLHPLPFAIGLERFVKEDYPPRLTLTGLSRRVEIAPQEGLTFTVPGDNATVTFDRVELTTRREKEVVPWFGGKRGQGAQWWTDEKEGAGRETLVDRVPGPAAEIEVNTERGVRTLWRLADRRRPEECVVRFDGRLAIYLFAGSPPDNEPWQDQPLLVVRNAETQGMIEVPARAGEVFTPPGLGPGAAGEIVEIKSDEKETAVGAVARVRITAAGKTGLRHAAAWYPDFNPDLEVGNPAFPQLQLLYYRPETVVRVVDRGDGKFLLLERVKGVTISREMAPGTPTDVAGTRVRLTPARSYPSAVVQTHEVQVESVLVRLKPSRGEEMAFWLSTDEPDRLARVSKDFGLGYVSTGEPREFRSDVELLSLLPSSRDVWKRASISVNHPVGINGWQIFQESWFGRGERQGTVLTVTYDPGLAFALAGLVLAAAGVFWANFVKPLLLRRRRSTSPAGKEVVISETPTGPESRSIGTPDASAGPADSNRTKA